jgi:hypothetical protein
LMQNLLQIKITRARITGEVVFREN